MIKDKLRYVPAVFMILFLSAANLFLIKLIRQTPRIPQSAPTESPFSHSVLDTKNPGELVLKGKAGNMVDISLVEGVSYKQVRLSSNKEKIKIPAGQYNISVNNGSALWVIVDRGGKTTVLLY